MGRKPQKKDKINVEEIEVSNGKTSDVDLDSADDSNKENTDSANESVKSGERNSSDQKNSDVSAEEYEIDDEVEVDMVEYSKEDVDEMDSDTLQKAMETVRLQITNLEDDLGEDAYDLDAEGAPVPSDIEIEAFIPPPHCVPIRSDVRAVNFDALGREVGNFDVIVMDPPWQLASSQPTRGVAIGYAQLPNKDIMDIPVPRIQKNGFLFIWVINARYAFALEMFEKWGYTLVDDITWVKTTVNRRMAKGHGFYLQHAKETCLVGKKGADPPGMVGNILSDIIFAERRGQSQKPEELYQMVEALVPNGKYCEIFARRNNLRNYWVSIGNEL